MFVSTPDTQAHNLTPEELLGLQVETPAGAVPWYLAGGIAATDVAYAVQPIRAESLAESYLRVAGDLGYPNCDPAVTGEGAVPLWTSADGWSNSAGGYLGTGMIPVCDQTWAMLVRFSAATGALCGLCAIVGNTGGNNCRFGPYPIYTGNVVRHSNGSFTGALPIDPSLTSGVLGVSGRACYRNGVPDGTIPVAVGVNLTLKQYMLRYNSNGTPIAAGTIKLAAFVVYKIAPTPTQMAMVSMEMMAL